MTRLRLLAFATALALAVALPGAVAAAQPATTLANPGVTVASPTANGCVATASVDITNLVGGHDTVEFILEDTDAAPVATGSVTLGHGATSASDDIAVPSGSTVANLDVNLYRGPNQIATIFLHLPSAYSC